MKAKILQKNDIIGVCAPSGVVSEKNKLDFLNSEKLLKEFDLKVIYSKNIMASDYGYSATPQKKSADFNELINNKNVNVIAFAKGGNNSFGILPFIDYEGIKNNPKIIFGFSDNTVLLNAIFKKTGLITYHFTNYKGLCAENFVFNKKQFLNVFLQGYKGKVAKNSKWITINEGIAKGKLVGGNLSSLVKLLGTEYCPNFKNKILFIEDLAIETSIEELSSKLYELKYFGVFDKINGLIIGNYNTLEKYTIEQVVLDVIGKTNIPIIKCNDFGHNDTNIILPIGINCTLDADKCELIFNENSCKVRN